MKYFENTLKEYIKSEYFLGPPPSPLNSENTQKSKWIPIFFQEKLKKTIKEKILLISKYEFLPWNPEWGSKCSLQCFSKSLNYWKIRYHLVHGKVLVDIPVILPFLLAGTSCAGWVHIPREHSTLPNCQRNETYIGNTCWGLVQSGETLESFSFSSRIFLTGRNKLFQSLGLWAFWHLIFDTLKLLPSRAER